MNFLHLKPFGQILLAAGLLWMSEYSAMALPLSAEIKAYSAQKKFEESRYEEAAEGYKAAAEKAPEHLKPILQYNQATSAAFAGETTIARELLGQTYAANNPTLNSAAKYNIATGIAKASKDSIAAAKDTANKTLNDPAILDLAEKNARTATGQAQQLPPEMTQALQSAAERVQKNLELVDEVITTTSQLGSLWREALIEQPGEKDAQHNAEVTALDKERLTELKVKLEELLKKLTPPDSKNQQQQSQDQKQQDQQNQDRKQSQDQKQQDQQKQDQKQQNQDKQQSQDQKQQDQQKQKQDQNSEQNKDQQTPPPSNDASDKDKQKDREEAKQPEKDHQQKQNDGQGKSNKSENRQKSAKAEPVKIGEMTEEDVQRMMNALPEDNEKVLQQILNIPTRPSAPPDKDW